MKGSPDGSELEPLLDFDRHFDEQTAMPSLPDTKEVGTPSAGRLLENSDVGEQVPQHCWAQESHRSLIWESSTFLSTEVIGYGLLILKAVSVHKTTFTPNTSI